MTAQPKHVFMQYSVTLIRFSSVSESDYLSAHNTHWMCAAYKWLWLCVSFVSSLCISVICVKFDAIPPRPVGGARR